jgi:receptor protein-tyrosine kinase
MSEERIVNGNGYAGARRDQAPAQGYPREQEELMPHGSVTANIAPRGLADYLNEILATAKRLYLLPIILAVVFSMLLCIRARIAFNPVYQASATFTVDVTNANSKGSASYTVNLAKQLSETFPYIFSSDVLSNLIMQDLGLTDIPATITAAAVGETNLFTINVYSRTPQMSYNILRSAINNYPRVADSVIGNTTLKVISDTGLAGKPTNAISYKMELLKGIALGLLISLIVIIIVTFTKTTVRDADDLKTMLNLKCLSTVPYIGRKRRGESGAIEISDPNMSKSFSDSIRLLRSRTERICAENDYRVILVASSMPGEGKTTVATNLAMSLAMSGKKVALLDCDLRKPSTMGELTNQKEHGLSEYLNGLVPLEEIINEPAENLIAISGKIPSDDAAEMLGSAKMKELIDELLERADLIVLDSPPSSVIADAVVLSNLSDCVVYVIRQEYTRKSRILDGLNHLSNGKAVFLGYVLNNGSGSGGYGYGYGAYGKYSRYGRYSRYSKYSRYSRYGRYGRYGKYGSYSRYGRYSRYSTYSRYGSYSRYRSHGGKK